jgi:hypothetical protein
MIITKKTIFFAQVVFLASIALSGCASVSSERLQEQRGTQSGLVYRLPNRAINISVVFEDGKHPLLTVTEGSSYPDASAPAYIANVRRNGIGQTDASISVGANGLLSDTSAKYTSQIDEFIKSLASSTAAFGTSGGRTGESDTGSESGCPKQGSFSYAFYLGPPSGISFDTSGTAEKPMTIQPGCEAKLTLKRAGWAPPTDVASKPQSGLPHTQESASYFYRINMPYIARVELAGLVKESVLLLPDESPTYTLSLPRALFASTDNTATFTDGVLTKHQQKTDSEVIAGLKIPADLLRAYISAMGSFFDSFKSTGLKEAQADTQRVLNEIQKQKLEACIIALRNDSTGDTSDALCAGIAMP